MIDPKKNYDFIKGEIMLFDKDRTWTSFDLVRRVRNTLCKQMGIKKLKVGHAGTLDPLATGLMILCTGKATKKIEQLQIGEKEYIATLKMGATTPSFDMETEEDDTFDTSHVTEKLITEKIELFLGTIDQVPPVFSAVKVDGKRAYEYARKGEEVKMRVKQVHIRTIELLEYNLPYLKLKIVCGKGTYVRSLARDLGEALDCGAYLTELKRTKIGKYSIENAITIKYFLDNLDLFVTN